jgi:glucose/arabinose dehydrogenase
MTQQTAIRQEDTGALELVCDGLTFPSSLTFDDNGNAFIGESGVPFCENATPGRIWKLAANGKLELMIDDLARPLNGVTWHDGSLYVSVGDDPGRIERISANGSREVIVDNLPGPGNYHVNMVVFGPDGKLYFSQGAMTNMAIIGLDAYELGWLKRLPHAHDVPGLDITLSGFNASSVDPFGDDGATTMTGAFTDFGTTLAAGTRIAAELPCTAAVMRCNADGSDLELVAWGIRNAYGLGFLPDGRLLATDQGSDDRGSRPIGDVPDLLFEVCEGRWYGWPDFIGGEPVTAERYRPLRGAPLDYLLTNHAELGPPEAALLRFPTHVAAVKFDVAPPSHAFAGQLFVALFGDERPMTAPEGPQAGRSVVRVDPGDWSMHDFIEGPLPRPIDIRFHTVTGDMYVLDFGKFEMDADDGVVAEAETGSLWRVAATPTFSP